MRRRIATASGWLLAGVVAAALVLAVLASAPPAPPAVPSLSDDGGADARGGGWIRAQRRQETRLTGEGREDAVLGTTARRLGQRAPVQKPPSPRPNGTPSTVNPVPPPPID